MLKLTSILSQMIPEKYLKIKCKCSLVPHDFFFVLIANIQKCWSKIVESYRTSKLPNNSVVRQIKCS